MYSNMENISSVVSKKSKKKFFSSPPTSETSGRGQPSWGVEKIFFSDFFETTLEMFSILKYICQKEILAEKNYSGCFREVVKFKQYT